MLKRFLDFTFYILFYNLLHMIEVYVKKSSWSDLICVLMNFDDV